MAFLYKRGKNYYVRYHWKDNDRERTVTRTLGTKYKDIAKERLEQLERLEEIGKINPHGENFKPLEVLEQPENNAIVCNTVQDAFKKFLESKSLSSS